jgi:fatty-acyl-CoA synthase
MAALELLPTRPFDADAFADFLAGQPDLGSKWVPAFVRISAALPQTASGKVTKAPLRGEGWWAGPDPVFRRIGASLAFGPMEEHHRDELRAQFRRHGRQGLVGG